MYLRGSNDAIIMLCTFRIQRILEVDSSLHIAYFMSCILKKIGLKNLGHLKMTQFGSNMLLLTRLLVTLGSISQQFRVKSKSKMTVHGKTGKHTKVYF